LWSLVIIFTIITAAITNNPTSSEIICIEIPLLPVKGLGPVGVLLSSIDVLPLLGEDVSGTELSLMLLVRIKALLKFAAVVVL
jgi:hypothetical protein